MKYDIICSAINAEFRPGPVRLEKAGYCKPLISRKGRFKLLHCSPKSDRSRAKHYHGYFLMTNFPRRMLTCSAMLTVIQFARAVPHVNRKSSTLDNSGYVREADSPGSFFDDMNAPEIDSSIWFLADGYANNHVGLFHLPFRSCFTGDRPRANLFYAA